jgi:hypothetical protein
VERNWCLKRGNPDAANITWRSRTHPGFAGRLEVWPDRKLAMESADACEYQDKQLLYLKPASRETGAILVIYAIPVS